jgi:hypothetical protein
MTDTAPEPHWESTQLAFKHTAIRKRIWQIKYLHNRLPIGEKLLQWNCTTNDLCPRCGPPETHRCHIIQCKHLEAQQLWLKALTALTQWLEKSHTQPNLQTIIIANLRAWHDDLPPRTYDFDWPGLTAANLKQNDLGWQHFYDGFLVPDWRSIQQAYCDYLEKQHTGRRWASQLIRPQIRNKKIFSKQRIDDLRDPHHTSRCKSYHARTPTDAAGNTSSNVLFGIVLCGASVSVFDMNATMATARTRKRMLELEFHSAVLDTMLAVTTSDEVAGGEASPPSCSETNGPRSSVFAAPSPKILFATLPSPRMLSLLTNDARPSS